MFTVKCFHSGLLSRKTYVPNLTFPRQKITGGWASPALANPTNNKNGDELTPYKTVYP